MRLTIATNMPALAQVRRAGVDLVVVPHRRGRGLEQWRHAWRCLGCDYALINCSPRDLFFFCLLKGLFPFSRVRVVSLDTVLPVPSVDGWRRRLGLWCKRALFRRSHLFVEYFRETDGYERHYGIPRDKFRYVPFKVNRYERVLQTATRDDGYVFCGGNTRRDFDTLLEAARRLPYPFKIVTMSEAIINGHGSSLGGRALPKNVEVVRHDGSDSFLDFIAAARLVALPIKRANISASGIGVYLASMALGKCVVISAGPAVNGIVPAGAAVVVPPEEPEALREAIDRAYRDDGYREAVAASGRAYALGLGGEDRLADAVAGVLIDDHQMSRGASDRQRAALGSRA